MTSDFAAAERYSPTPRPMEPSEPVGERPRPDRGNRLLTATSVVDQMRQHVDNLTTVAPEDLPEWLKHLEIPEGWVAAHITAGSTPLSRVMLYGHRPEGGWEGCETLSVFRFGGAPPKDLLRENADRTLRDLGADSVSTFSLFAAAESSASAARSSGYFTAAGRRVWAQFSAYIGTGHDGEGFLIEHAVYTDAAHRSLLRDDISDLGDAVHAAFIEQVDTVETHDVLSQPQSRGRHPDGT